MPMTTFREFCDGVLGQMPRATGRERDDIREELLDHLMEHRDMLVEYGYDPVDAEQRSIAAMGDPAEIGRAWNKALSPFWLWLGRLCAVAFALILLFNADDIYYKYERIRDAMEVRYGEGYESREIGSGYNLFWETEPGIEKPFGDHIIRIERVELYERITGPLKEYAAQVYYVTWHRDPWGKSLDSSVLYSLTYDGAESWGGGSSETAYATWKRDELEVHPYQESLHIRLEHMGNLFEAEIPLDWGGATA